MKVPRVFSSLPAWVQVALPAGFLLLLGLAARRVDMNQKEKAKTPDIVIDPGHGGRDPGAVNPTTNTTEKEINLSTALTLKYLLEQEGLTVALTRTGDTYPGLYDRTQDAQRAGARVFVSVHYDTYTRQARGVYYGDSAGSRELAQKIAAALPRLAEPNWVKSHKESRFGRLYIADFTAGPSVLIEFGPTAPVGRELVPGQGEALLWLVQALLVVGLVRLAGEALAGLAGLVPGVGPVLAAALRLFAGSYERWLAQKVPALADVAVQRSEEALKGAGGPAKLGAAVAQLQRSAPGLSPGQARAQVEAALTRLRGAGLEQKSGGK